MTCPTCNGDGFTMIDENPVECRICNGEGTINLPVYKEHGFSVNKVISEDEYIQVDCGEDSFSNELGAVRINCAGNVKLIINAGEEITEGKFLSAYVKATQDLDNLVHGNAYSLQKAS